MKSDREVQILYDIVYMWNLKKKDTNESKKDTNEFIYKTETES